MYYKLKIREEFPENHNRDKSFSLEFQAENDKEAVDCGKKRFLELSKEGHISATSILTDIYRSPENLLEECVHSIDPKLYVSLIKQNF